MGLSSGPNTKLNIIELIRLYLRGGPNTVFGNMTNLDVLQYNGSTITNRQPLGIETSQTLNAAAANDTVIGNSLRLYGFLSLPTTAPYFQITKVDWKNGATINGNVMVIFEEVDGIYPTSAQVTLWAFTRQAAQSGAGAVQQNDAITWGLIPGGTILGVAIWSSSASATFATATVSSANNSKAVAYSSVPAVQNGTAWTAGTEEPYLEIHYKPFMGV